MSQAFKIESLEQIAHATAHAKQTGHLGDVYLAVATMFANQSDTLSGNQREMATDIVRRLTKDVEMSIRIALAEKLADDPRAPHELIVLLADDQVDVALPLLHRSPVLTDQDLVRVIESGAVGHQIAVAQRPSIGEPVTATLVRCGSNAVLTELLRNKSARIASDTFGIMIERSRGDETLHAPLIERSDLPPVLANRLYSWVSAALKSALIERFPLAAQPIADAIGDATTRARTGEPAESPTSAVKLIRKLAASGHLRTSFLIRVLNQGQLDLFEYGFSELLKIDVDLARRALYATSPVPLALACRAVGIDRVVFLTVLNLSRHHRGTVHTLGKSDQDEIGLIFANLSKTEALSRLKASILS